MKILTDTRLLKVIKEESIANDLTLEQEIQAMEVYHRVMKEDLNKNKTLKEQESLIATICQELGTPDDDGNPTTPEWSFRHHSDNRHMGYFDIFLEKGESDIILEVLQKNNLPTSILRGLHKNQDYNVKLDNGVEVYQKVESVNGDSPIIVDFSIIKDGNIIYQWNRRRDIPLPQNRINALEQQGFDVIVEKDAMERSKNYKVTYFSEEGDVIKEYRRITKSGKKVKFFMSNGKFVSGKEYGLK